MPLKEKVKINNISSTSKEDLGQVFTPDNLARLMSLLLIGDKREGRVLDPCIGNNVFLKTIDSLFPKNNFLMDGVEVDKELVDSSFYTNNSKRIFVKNFFDFSPLFKYDFLIMNPPYVRQEQLSTSKINSKRLINKVLENTPFKSNSQTNLYVYFFIKALQHLKPGGRMVAICYDSWLYTRYGEIFKEYLNDNTNVKKIIHFKKSAFDNANVGATIIELEKTSKKSVPVKISIDDARSIPVLNNKKELNVFLKNLEGKDDDLLFDFNELFFEDIGNKFTNIKRGLETPANEFFYLPNDIKTHLAKPIIKDIKKIDSYRALKKSTRRVLLVKEKKLTNIEKKIKDYLLDVKKNVVSSKGRYKTLEKSIIERKDWFVIKEVVPGNIVFNYYFRDKTNFIYNPSKYFVSNNFYTMNSTDAFVDLAILNSSLTKASLVLNARTQGRGLRKLQLYEFKKVRVFRKELLSKEEIKVLRNYGKLLCSSSSDNDEFLIKKIDLLLLAFLNKTTGKSVDYQDIQRYKLLS